MPTPSFTIDPTSIPRNAISFLVTLNGIGTNWTADTDSAVGSPVFALTGGAGSVIVSQAIYSPTLATLLINAGPSIATLTITDPQNNITATVPVASTFEELMVAKLEALLAQAVGFTSITIDGQIVAVQDLSAQREGWLRRVNQQNGKRRRVAGINLGNPHATGGCR